MRIIAYKDKLWDRKNEKQKESRNVYFSNLYLIQTHLLQKIKRRKQLERNREWEQW